MKGTAEVRERLELYRNAERAILTGHQEYAIEGMTFKRADLQKIQQAIGELELSLQRAEKGNGFSCQQVIF